MKKATIKEAAEYLGLIKVGKYYHTPAPLDPYLSDGEYCSTPAPATAEKVLAFYNEYRIAHPEEFK